MGDAAQPESAKVDAGERIRRRLEQEIAGIERELKIELPAELKRARALGDLSENAEFKFAKERQHLLESRAGQLRKRLASLALVNLAKIPRDRAGYGSRLKLLDLEQNSEIDYRLVTAEESDAAAGLISTTSPIGRALMGKQAGDTVKVQTPAGARQFEIMRLATIYDE